MLPLPDPACRTMPVDLPAAMVRGVISGRIRLLHLPGPRAAMIGPGDCLWVREQYRVYPAGPGRLDVLYGAERMRGVRWPAALTQPSAGAHVAEAMPVQLSRLTLVVHAARTIRVQQVGGDDAIAAGVVINPTGFGHPWADEADWPSAVEAFAHMWDIVATRASRHGWAANPEVRQVSFRAVARNIGDLVAGAGGLR